MTRVSDLLVTGLWGIFITSPVQQAVDMTLEAVTAAAMMMVTTIAITIITPTQDPPTNHLIIQGCH